MAARVVISGAAIEAQVRPSVQQWVNGVTRKIQVEAVITAPVNDPNNALHRGGVVGTYKKGLKQGRAITVGTLTEGTVAATADHSWWVEFGRRPNLSAKVMRFSWVHAGDAGWGHPKAEYGEFGPVFTHFVRGYRGHHTLGGAFSRVVRGLDI